MEAVIAALSIAAAVASNTAPIWIPAVAMGGLAYASASGQAKAQSKYTSAAYAAQLKAASANQRQISDQESLEQLKARNKSAQIRSRIRAASADMGMGFGGTYDSLMQQANFDEIMDLNIIRKNAKAKMAGLVIQPVQQQYSNPLLSGIMAGMEGIGTGLQISSGLSSLMPEGTGGYAWSEVGGTGFRAGGYTGGEPLAIGEAYA